MILMCDLEALFRHGVDMCDLEALFNHGVDMCNLEALFKHGVYMCHLEALIKHGVDMCDLEALIRNTICQGGLLFSFNITLNNHQSSRFCNYNSLFTLIRNYKNVISARESKTF